MSAVKRVEFVSDRMSFIILRGRWCHIIVLNIHAPTEDKTDDVKDRIGTCVCTCSGQTSWLQIQRSGFD
jgi:hypothetical protein